MPISEFSSVLEENADTYYAAKEVFRIARLKEPAGDPFRWRDEVYYPISAVSGLHWQLDRKGQALFLSVPPSAFLDSVVDGTEPVQTAVEKPSPGFFLNHDFQFLRHAENRSLSGVVEGGFFSALGVLTNRAVTSDLLQRKPWTRLDTQFARDFPARRSTLTIGDSISAATPWARQVYYGGIRWASKFSTQPGFLPVALPSLSGEAVQPSVIDVYVDNVRQMSRRVDTGPFSVLNVPVIAGQGQIRMVVTDLLGRQQVVTQSYLRTSELLRRGVSDFTYEAGSLRQNYGRESFDYRSAFAAGAHRYGLTDTLTVSGRAELLPDRQTVGAGVDAGVRSVGLVGAGVVGSQSAGQGGYLAYGHFRHMGRALGFSGRWQAASPEFRQLGMLRGEQAALQILQADISHAIKNRGSITLGYLRRDGRTEPELRALTFSVSVRVGRAFLSVSTNSSMLGERHRGANISLLIPMGVRRIAVATADLQRETKTSVVQIEQHLPLATGYGYRVRASGMDSRSVDAGVSYQNQQGTYGLDVSQVDGRQGWRASERGSLVFLRGHVLASRWLNDSFAVVRVPDQPGVRVLVNNQPMGRTGRRGTALIPWLVPYDRNSVQLDQSGLPLDLEVELDKRTVVPMPRSGLFLQFTAKQVRGAVVQLVQEDGTPVPAGAQVSTNFAAGEYPVALRGEVFLPEMQYPATLTARWEERQCSASVTVGRPETLLPRLGPFVCVEVQR